MYVRTRVRRYFMSPLRRLLVDGLQDRVALLAKVPASPLLDAVFCEQLEDVVAHENAALKALDADLAVDVLRHVGDDALFALAELLRGRLRSLLASFAAWLLEAEAHAFHLSRRARGAGCRRPPHRRRVM